MRERATRRVGRHPKPDVATPWLPPLPMPADSSPSATVVGDLSSARSLGSLLLAFSVVSCLGVGVRCHAVSSRCTCPFGASWSCVSLMFACSFGFCRSCPVCKVSWHLSLCNARSHNTSPVTLPVHMLIPVLSRSVTTT